jgi:NADH dehydrogenase/NADH:ubiquinone oxidoreductase subunit G
VELLPESARYIALVDYANSRGAFDMGVTPGEGGLTWEQMVELELDVLWVVGANPLSGLARRAQFLVVQELFLTETARQADVVLPALAAYEKSGSFTNTCGEVQRLTKGPVTSGPKSDLEIMGLIARQMGCATAAPTAEAVLEEIRRTAPGYDIPYANFLSGGAVPTSPQSGHFVPARAIQSARDSLFTSGTLGRYCPVLLSVREKDMVRVAV